MATASVNRVWHHIQGIFARHLAVETSDRELLARFAVHHDEEAFAQLVERHGALVLGVCRRVLGNLHDAEDAFQAAFLVLARKAGAGGWQESVASWLFTVAYHLALRAKHQRDRRWIRETEAAAMMIPTVPVSTELQHLLDRELANLPEKYRAALVLCCLEGKSRVEAARELGWSAGAVKGKLERARELLRSRLQRHGVTLSLAGLALALERAAAVEIPLPLLEATKRAACLYAGQGVVAGQVSAQAANLAGSALTGMLVRKALLGLALLLAGVGVAALRWSAPAADASAAAKALAEPAAPVIRSAQSGPWSAPTTWEGGKVPGAGARVLVREGHRVVYDVQSDQVIRGLNIAGTLSFAPKQDTRLSVGLIKIQLSDVYSEEGFDCEAHGGLPDSAKPRPALEVGTAEQPIDAGHTAHIRLVYIDGMNQESCPAIVCCGGCMDFHGAPLSHAWIKLGQPARAGDRQIQLLEPVKGWRVGDRILVTATTRQNKVKKTFRPSVRDSSQTEERLITAIAGGTLTLDQPLTYDHQAEGNYRADVANLSRNVVVESADPKGVRGHTMYHRYSAGSLRYTEFRHLGKPAVLGRYSLHFHLVGDTMRGSSVIGNSIWDSGNRWLTIHGTNYLVVRDNVGYQSLGHGFFLEDGTEVYNVLDRNLAVQAYTTKPLPRQVLPFDQNDGSGFWWANSLNTFTRNVAAECDEYGYFFQVTQTPQFNPVLPVQQADGSVRRVDLRTLPFVRFEDNEAHCQRRHAFNLGGGVPFGDAVAGIGPDNQHPFVIRNFRSWNVHWAIHPVSPALILENLDIFNAEYGIWRPLFRRHAYRNIRMEQVPEQTKYAFINGAPPNGADFPMPLEPVDDLPPTTVITHIQKSGGKLVVRGTAADNGTITKVLVNGQEAKPLSANFAEWQIELESASEVKAHATDAAGNVEKLAPAVSVM